MQRSQAAYLAEAQRLSQTGSFGWNVSTGELVWSEETFRIFGYDASTSPTLEMILGRVHPDDVALVRRTIERAASDNEELDFEHRLLMPDGSTKTLHVVGHPMSDQPGPRQFVGAVMDVTARTTAYVALERTEQRYRRLFQHMPISLWQVDVRGVPHGPQHLETQRAIVTRRLLEEFPWMLRGVEWMSRPALVQAARHRRAKPG